MNQPKEEMIPALWVYIGKTELEGGKVGRLLRRTDRKKMIGEPCAFPIKRSWHPVVGGIYQIQTSKDFDSVVGSSATFVERWHDERDVFQWEARSRMIEISRRARSKERRAKAEKIIPAALKDLRDLYWHTDPMGRLAIEVWILAYLRMQRAE